MHANLFRGIALAVLGTIGAAALAQAPAGGPPPAGPGAGGPPRPALAQVVVESRAFEDGGIVPLKFSLYGTNTQPDFRISNLPATAQSVALIFRDIDVALAGNPDDNLHWMVWNIPVAGGVATLEEGGLPEGALSRGPRGAAYVGMGAPNGPRYHHYVFEFYALNGKLDLPEAATRADLLEAMRGKVVGKAAYVGRFRNDTNATMPQPAGR